MRCFLSENMAQRTPVQDFWTRVYLLPPELRPVTLFNTNITGALKGNSDTLARYVHDAVRYNGQLAYLELLDEGKTDGDIHNFLCTAPTRLNLYPEKSQNWEARSESFQNWWRLRRELWALNYIAHEPLRVYFYKHIWPTSWDNEDYRKSLEKD